jgi:arginase family enzyme
MTGFQEGCFRKRKNVIHIGVKGMDFAPITILNLDDTYPSQKRLLTLPHRWIDMSDIRSTNMIADPFSVKAIQSRLSRWEGPSVVFLGSGNYHYITYLLLKKITVPFTLVLFDRHTDLGQMEDDYLSCGSWVSFALKIPFCRKVLIIGPPKNVRTPKLSVFSTDQADLNKKFLREIAGRDIYISIDKDVLSETCAVTNWDQGELTLDELLAFLEALFAEKRVIGMDVCGEYPKASISPWDPLVMRATKINEKANLQIARHYLQYMKKNRKIF